ncbi:MAG: SDR family NAD(P)-dependent oxidoreductase, partial [bacterium]|nr:SDR family NAD(P)-dependent oxidoreductase [bacterium]
GVATALAEADCIPVEVGPGTSLATFVRERPSQTATLPSLPHPNDRRSALALILGSLGKLWLAGAEVDWQGLHAGRRRRRVPLPTYPFEHRRYWIGTAAPATTDRLVKTQEIEDWFYRPVWQETEAPAECREQPDGCWLVLRHASGLGSDLGERLVRAGAEVWDVTVADQFERIGDRHYGLRPGVAEDYAALFAELVEQGRQPSRCVHCWNVTAADEIPFTNAQDLGFYSLVFFAQAWVERFGTAPLRIDVVSDQLRSVTGNEPLRPEKSTLLAPCLVIPQEHPYVACRSIDVAPEERVDRLLAEVLGPPDDRFVAWRGGVRRVEAYERFSGPAAGASFRQGGVYLIIGGLGGIGLAVARHLAATVQARLILTRRSPLPETRDDDGDAADPVIGRIRELETLGAEVMAVSADIADEARMQQLTADARTRFGALHGVIHAAGIMAEDSFQLLTQATREQCERHFAPKVYGLYALERVLAG